MLILALTVGVLHCELSAVVRVVEDGRTSSVGVVVWEREPNTADGFNMSVMALPGDDLDEEMVYDVVGIMVGDAMLCDVVGANTDDWGVDSGTALEVPSAEGEMPKPH